MPERVVAIGSQRCLTPQRRPRNRRTHSWIHRFRLRTRILCCWVPYRNLLVRRPTSCARRRLVSRLFQEQVPVLRASYFQGSLGEVQLPGVFFVPAQVQTFLLRLPLIQYATHCHPRMFRSRAHCSSWRQDWDLQSQFEEGSGDKTLEDSENRETGFVEFFLRRSRAERSKESNRRLREWKLVALKCHPDSITPKATTSR